MSTYKQYNESGAEPLIFRLIAQIYHCPKDNCKTESVLENAKSVNCLMCQTTTGLY